MVGKGLSPEVLFHPALLPLVHVMGTSWATPAAQLYYQV
jgi:hypothetical protein